MTERCAIMPSALLCSALSISLPVYRVGCLNKIFPTVDGIIASVGGRLF